MKNVNEKKITDFLKSAEKVDPGYLTEVLDKSRALNPLTLEETAFLLTRHDKDDVKQILKTARQVKRSIYGDRVVLFAPLYISNICSNYCEYCSFKADNELIVRKKLSQDEIAKETIELLKKGHKRVLMVAAEGNENDDEYFVRSIRTIYKQEYKGSKIRRINVNCAPLSVDGFRKLKKEGIGTYQIFQETYHDKTYRIVHPKGPKSDPDKRLEAIRNAFEAGIDDIGIGVLYGLYDYKFETLALLSHIKYMERKFGVGPHTISVPRIEPAVGADLTSNIPFRLNDEDFKKLVAILRLSVPYTGMILSTREAPQMRDDLFDLGISQISAGSRTSPGGYSEEEGNIGKQFKLNDHRTLDQIIGSLIGKKAIPSFCTACYRKERTGKVFMGLAKPGTIKGKCKINALITLKEYLDDFASAETKKSGYKLIDEVKKTLDDEEMKGLDRFFSDINEGVRDEFV